MPLVNEVKDAGGSGSNAAAAQDSTRRQRRNEVRIEESREEVSRLRHDLAGWFEERAKRDKVAQYQTQLGSLQHVLGIVLDRVHDDLGSLRATDPTGSVYVRCRANDRRTVFVRRFWTFFREKFDQRDVPALAAVVAAADEVVWSCYTTGFEALRSTPLAAPLPYVDSELSPHALTRSVPPPELASDARDEVLRDSLKLLPFPLIGIPSVCLARPWWLIFLAHETGHQLQTDLADGILRKSFGELLSRAVTATGGAAAGTEAQWSGWSQEVFADAVSVLAVGVAAARAMSELETSDDGGALRSSFAYPPPIVRSALMEALAGAAAGIGPAGAPSDGSRERADAASAAAVEHALAFVGAAVLAAEDEPLRDPARAYLAAVPAVTRTLICEPLGELPPLPSLCEWSSGHVGRIETWCDDFGGGGNPFPEHNRESARLALAGAYHRWLEVAELAASERGEAQATLRTRILATVPNCREPAVRATREPATQGREAIAAEIANRVFAAVGADGA